jgi:hypothetical protein
VTYDPEDWLLTARERGNPATILDERQAGRQGTLVGGCTSHHRPAFARLDGVPVAALAGEPLLLAEEATAPEFNQLTVETCRAAGFTPTVYQGTVESIRAAAGLVAAGRCLYCSRPPASPRSPAPPGGHSPSRPPPTRGRSYGAPPMTPATSAPSSAAPGHYHNAPAG